MIRAATMLADPCTGARRRDFLLGLHRGQLAGAQVPSWCSWHGWAAGCSQRVGPPGQLTARRDQTPGGYRVDGPLCGIAVPRLGRCRSHVRRPPVGQVSRIGMDTYRPPIEMSPLSPFQMSLSSPDGCWERVTDDGDCDEPHGDRPDARAQGSGRWPDYGE